MTKADIIRNYLDIYIEDIKTGNISKKGLAKIIFSDHEDKFKDVENVRNTIRSVTGAGWGNSKVTHPFVSTIKHGLKAVPKSLADPIPDFIFPDHKKVGIIADVHIPYHDDNAVVSAIEYLKGVGIDSLLINGDCIDFYQGSKFIRDPRKIDIPSEVQMLNAFIEWLKQELDVPIYYKIGNHEERLENYIFQNAEKLVGFDALETENLLGLDVEYIKGRQLIKMGKLNIVHGHEFGRSIFNPVNPARGLFLKTKTNAMCAHYHQASEHSESNLNKKPLVCYSLGCLCDMRPEYASFAYTKWNHGFAVVRLDGDMFSVELKKIIAGKVL